MPSLDSLTTSATARTPDPTSTTGAKPVQGAPVVHGPRSLTDDANGYYFLRIKFIGSQRHQLLSGDHLTLRRVKASQIKPSRIDAVIQDIWESNPGEIASFSVEPIRYRSVPLFTAGEMRHAG